MLSQGYLALTPVRLDGLNEWTAGGGGFSFLFVKSGAAVVSYGSRSQRVVSGDALVLNGRGSVKLRPADQNSVDVCGFALSLEHLYPLFTGGEISLLPVVNENFKGFRAYAAAHSIAAECHRLICELSPQYSLENRGQLLRVATLLAEEFRMAQTQRAGYVRMEDHVCQVFERLSAEELLGLPVGELAERFGCSRRHLNRLFNQYFGFSVAAFKMELRLLRAASLLRAPDAKVIHVAEQCGFNHLGLFNICFKRRFGVSPGRFRKQASGQAGEKPESALTPLSCPLRPTGLCPFGLPVNPNGALSSPVLHGPPPST